MQLYLYFLFVGYLLPNSDQLDNNFWIFYYAAAILPKRSTAILIPMLLRLDPLAPACV